MRMLLTQPDISESSAKPTMPPIAETVALPIDDAVTTKFMLPSAVQLDMLPPSHDPATIPTSLF